MGEKFNFLFGSNLFHTGAGWEEMEIDCFKIHFKALHEKQSSPFTLMAEGQKQLFCNFNGSKIPVFLVERGENANYVAANNVARWKKKTACALNTSWRRVKNCMLYRVARRCHTLQRARRAIWLEAVFRWLLPRDVHMFPRSLASQPCLFLSLTHSLHDLTIIHHESSWISTNICGPHEIKYINVVVVCVRLFARTERAAAIQICFFYLSAFFACGGEELLVGWCALPEMKKCTVTLYAARLNGTAPRAAGLLACARAFTSFPTTLPHTQMGLRQHVLISHTRNCYADQTFRGSQRKVTSFTNSCCISPF